MLLLNFSCDSCVDDGTDYLLSAGKVLDYAKNDVLPHLSVSLRSTAPLEGEPRRTTVGWSENQLMVSALLK
jgi:hypothetical protein